MSDIPEPTTGVLDTSVFIGIETDRPVQRDLLPARSWTTVITLGELNAGVLAADTSDQRGRRLRTLTNAARLPLLQVDARAAARWGQLRVHLAESGRRAPVNDVWIAAVALAHRLPIVTQDHDFDALEDFPGIELIRV